MIIRILADSEFDKYFSSNMDGKSIYNDRNWQNLFSNVENYIILDNDNKFIGGFVLRCEKKMGGLKFYKSLNFTPTISLFIQNKTQNAASKLAFEKNLMEELSIFFESLPYSILKLAFPPEFKDLQPFIWKKFKVVPNYTYRIDLELSIDELNSKMSPKRRNDLKKAIKDGVEVKLVESYEDVLLIINKTFERKDLNTTGELVKSILYNFSNNQNSFGFVAYKEGKPIATAFCIFDNKTSYYILGGYDAENRHQSAGALCVWESILHSKNLGLKTFDFEGSMLPPVERYFRDFGGDLTPYYTISKAKLPIELLLKFVKREYF